MDAGGGTSPSRSAAGRNVVSSMCVRLRTREISPSATKAASAGRLTGMIMWRATQGLGLQKIHNNIEVDEPCVENVCHSIGGPSGKRSTVILTNASRVDPPLDEVETEDVS